MSRRKKDPLRPLTDPERQSLTQLSRSQTAPAVQVARATMLPAVSDGADYQVAARRVGRRSGDAVSSPVSRFNADSTYTIRQVLHEAGYSHQRTRTRCPTGFALRRRVAVAVVVTDPDAEPKKR
jgi:hypothetical protein